MKTQKMKLSEIVLDFSVYPRSQVDSGNVSQLREAFRAGVDLPPPVIDQDSKRVVDGFHRVTMYRREMEPDAEIEVEVRDFGDESHLFSEAVRMNAAHGRPLSPFDRARCAARLKKYKIGVAKIAALLGVRVETLKAVAERRVAKTTDGREMIVKRSIAHVVKSGAPMTEAQEAANVKLDGMPPIYHAGQLLLLIENDLIDTSNADLMERLSKLGAALDRYASAGVA